MGHIKQTQEAEAAVAAGRTAAMREHIAPTDHEGDAEAKLEATRRDAERRRVQMKGLAKAALSTHEP